MTLASRLRSSCHHVDTGESPYIWKVLLQSVHVSTFGLPYLLGPEPTDLMPNASDSPLSRFQYISSILAALESSWQFGPQGCVRSRQDFPHGRKAIPKSLSNSFASPRAMSSVGTPRHMGGIVYEGTMDAGVGFPSRRTRGYLCGAPNLAYNSATERLLREGVICRRIYPSRRSARSGG